MAKIESALDHTPTPYRSERSESLKGKEGTP